MRKVIILTALILFVFAFDSCYASGVTYSTNQIGENTIKVSLKAALSLGQGMEITSVSKREGKELNIFYRVGKGITGMDSIDVDLKTMLPPIRIILTNIDKPDEGIFNDIKGIYAEGYIRHLHDMGALGGYPDGSFRPKKTVTRAEFITILLNSLKVEKKPATKGFKDTGKHWAKDAISTACEMKIINGFQDGTFKPDSNVTAAEAAVIIGRLFKFGTTAKKDLPNLNIKHWAYNNLKTIFSAGLIIKEDQLYKNFKEDTPLNRADCTMIISRAITTN